MIPFFFFFAFGLLQASQLGVALVMTNYAASSIARKAATDPTVPTTTKNVPLPLATYNPSANNLMVAGMQYDTMQGCVTQTDPSVPTGALVVAVRSKIPAWPFFGELIHGALKDTYDQQGISCTGTLGGFGPFNFSAQAPYYFYVTGVAKAGLNYIQ